MPNVTLHETELLPPVLNREGVPLHGTHVVTLSLFHADDEGQLLEDGPLLALAVLWLHNGEYFASMALTERDSTTLVRHGPSVRVEFLRHIYKPAHRQELTERLTVLLIFWGKWAEDMPSTVTSPH